MYSNRLLSGGFAIELWDLQHTPYLDRTIRLGFGAKLEGLAWAGNRLFSVDLNGRLIEWNLLTMRPLHKQRPTGNALWCLDVNKSNTELAVGSEEGHINILNLDNGELAYKSLFNKQKGRVLCCKFDSSGERLVTGSTGVVRIWDVAKGSTLHTMTLQERTAHIHSLLVLRDNTIIAGDSFGYVTMWSGDNATQLETSKILESHVLALAINEEQDRLVCSGKNPPLIRVLSKTLIKREDSTYECWIKFMQREVHSHMVKTLMVVGNRVFSGGQDGILSISFLNREGGEVTKYPPFLEGPVATVASSENLMLLRYRNVLHLWRLGMSRPDETTLLQVGELKALELVEAPERLLALKLPKASYMIAAGISPDNKWICYSTQRSLRVSRLQLDPLAVLSLQGGPEELKPSRFIHFTKDNQLYLVYFYEPILCCFDVEDFEVKFRYKVDMSEVIKAPIRHVQISPCGKHLAVATSDYLVSVWQLLDTESKQAEHLLNLPRLEVGITAMALHANIGRLVVAYANGRIVEYDLDRKHFYGECKKRFTRKSRFYPNKGIILDERNPNVLIVYTDYTMYVLHSYMPEQRAQAWKSKMKKIEDNIEEDPLEMLPPLRSYRLKSAVNRPVSSLYILLDLFITHVLSFLLTPPPLVPAANAASECNGAYHLERDANESARIAAAALQAQAFRTQLRNSLWRSPLL